MNAQPEPMVTVLVPATRGLHLLQAVLGQLQTSEVRVVVSESDNVETVMPDSNISHDAPAGALRFAPIQGL